MRRILFVLPYLEAGGTERALSNITTHFPDDWVIDILVNNDQVIAYPYRGNIISLGIMDRTKEHLLVFQLYVLLKRIQELKRLKRSKKYYACVSFLDSANVANIISGSNDCKVLVSVRNSLLQQNKLPQFRYIVNPLAKILYDYADKVVAVSEGIETELRDFLKLRKEKIKVIENGCDFLKIANESQRGLTADENRKFSNRKIVVTVGRLTVQKGQWHLIRAFNEVVRNIPDVLLMILGTGELEKYLKKLVSLYGLNDSVYFMGYVTNPYKYMIQSDVFVLPSLYEGFPNAMAEAICLGVPCIAADFRTGARELLAPGEELPESGIKYKREVQYGILTPVCSGIQYNSVEEPLELSELMLAKAMIEILQDEKKREEYCRKSKLRSKSLNIYDKVKEWIDVIEKC